MKIDFKDFEGQTFVFAHKNFDGAVSVSVCNEESLPEVVGYFKDFLKGCGFHPSAIDELGCDCDE